MHRTQGEDYVEIDGKRMYQAANPATATKATRLPAASMNAIQEEISRTIEGAGITLSATAAADETSGWSQLLQSIKILSGWKTFTPENGTIDTGTWANNSIVQMQAWANEIINTGSTIKDSVMLILPKWGSTGTKVTTSCTFTHNLTTGEDFSCAIPAGNLLIVSFGADAKVSEYARLPMSADNTSAIFKTLSVSGSLSFPAGSISEAMIANDAVTSHKIAAGAVEMGAIAVGAVTEDTIAMGAVTKDAIAVGAVTKDTIAVGAVTEGKIADGAVTEGKIANDAVTSHKIAARAVEMGAIAVGAVTEDTIAAGAVTEGKIADGAVSLIKLSGGVKLLWRQNFSFSSTVLTPSGITSAYVACPRKLIEGFSLRIVIRSDTWSTTLEVMSIVIGGQTFTNLTSGWIYEDECHILDNVPITSSMCVDFINVSINTANFSTGQLVMSVQQYV